MPRPRPGRCRGPPADHVGRALDGLGPVAVGRRVVRDERLAGSGEVAQPQVERVDAERVRRLVHVRLDRPDLLRVAEATERGRGHGVGEHAPGEDPDVRHAIRAVRGVAALRDGPVGDVGVGADQVVRLDVAEDERAVASEPGPDVDLGRSPADGLERLLEREHEADLASGRARHEREQRLVLRMLLATERPARVRREHADLREREAEQVGDDPLEPVRVLDRAPDHDPVAVGRGHVGVGLDGELGDHREGVRALDDEVGLGWPRPRRRPSRDGARGGRSCRRTGRRGGARGPGRAARPGRAPARSCGARAAPRTRPRRARRPPRRHRGSRRRPRRRVRRGTSSRRWRGRAGRGAAARSGASGRAGRPAVITRRTPGTRERGGGVDAADPRPRHVERDELHVEDVVVGQVGDVLLLPGDAGTAADPGCRLPDAHCGATFASGTAERSPTGGAALVVCVGFAARGSLDRLDDLLVAGAAAEVAGEALLDLGAGRVRREGEQRLRGDELARDAEAALRGAGVEERLLERMEPIAGRQPLDGADGRAVRLDREHQARIDAHAVDHDGAGAAFADEAALLRAGQPEIVAQDLEERVVRRDLDRARPAVDGQLDRRASSSRRRAGREPLDGDRDRPKAEDAEHRQPVLRARPHRAGRRAGRREQGLEQLRLGALRRAPDRRAPRSRR